MSDFRSESVQRYRRIRRGGVRVYRGVIFLSLIAVQLQGGLSLSQTKESSSDIPAYLDPILSIDQRVDDLVSRMTREEKASQLINESAAIPRLRIPAYQWRSEALHGVAANGVTVFPEPIGLAATFDVSLVDEMAVVTSVEARAFFKRESEKRNLTAIGLDFWAPNVNIFRDPRWGRGQETFGEDPFLTSTMGVAFVKGMQGDDPNYLRVIATPKHYAVHSGPEPTRHNRDVFVSAHDLEDTYLPAFRATVVDGKAASIMCAYSSLNGDPACANSYLLQDILRKRWGFNGYVVSDCDAIYDIYSAHHYTRTLAEAAAVSLKRGTDLDCGNDYSPYLDALHEGLISDQELDTAVKRLMKARFLLGMFDNASAVKYTAIPDAEINSEAHRQLATRAARESMVLLKNDGVLPISGNVKKIAVIGPLADSIQALYGNFNGTNGNMVTALDGIRKQFTDADVTFVPGTHFLRAKTTVVSGDNLTTADGIPGLTGEYFSGMDLRGSPVTTRIDKQVNFDFGGKAPAPGLTGQDYSVRWAGFLTPSTSGDYEIGVTGDDGYRLWIDGILALDEWDFHKPLTKTIHLGFQKGHKYSIKLEYFQGEGGAVAQLIWTPPALSDDAQMVSDAVSASNKSDLVIAVMGITSVLESQQNDMFDVPGFNGGDRTDLKLPQEEETLLRAIETTGKPLVVVLMNGSSVAVNWAKDNANAILEAWYPGEGGGTAIAETLAGVNNPAGRLPVTFYTGIDQLPPFDDYSMNNRTYRYFEGRPLYPFGFGLSYSRFGYRNLKVSTASLKAGNNLRVEADVDNLGNLPGDEVAQVYLMFPNRPGAPRLALRGLSRVHLDAHQSQHLQFDLSPRDLSMVNEKGERLIADGSYQLSIGGGQPGTGVQVLTTRLSIYGKWRLPE